jgi:hypothetical protein
VKLSAPDSPAMREGMRLTLDALDLAAHGRKPELRALLEQLEPQEALDTLGSLAEFAAVTIAGLAGGSGAVCLIVNTSRAAVEEHLARRARGDS